LPFIWEATPEALPTNRSAVTAVRNFKGGRRIAPLTLDHCFSGGEGPLDIAWEDRALGLRLTGPDGKRAAAHTVIYTPQAHDFFCVEPVSHAPNAVNLPDSADITGLTILNPGARMTLACRFEVRGL
jgi:aldose 1-epimerase